MLAVFSEEFIKELDDQGYIKWQDGEPYFNGMKVGISPEGKDLSYQFKGEEI